MEITTSKPIREIRKKQNDKKISKERIIKKVKKRHGESDEIMQNLLLLEVYNILKVYN